MLKLIAMSCVVLSFFQTSLAHAVDPIKAERILVLGDSITNAGHYVVDLEIALRATSPSKVPNIINLGLPSETCCGLTEPDHPFPRPDVHDRLDKALAKTKPDLVIACYGMNDGIYHPFSEERFAMYQDGINRLVTKVHAAGAEVILLTPPPFDPQPLRGKPGKLLPAGSTNYGWKGVSDRYDQVIKTYGDWILENSAGADQVIDLQAPMVQFLKQQRKSQSDYCFAADGVHLNAEGHRVLAKAILAKWKVESPKGVSSKLQKLVYQKERLLHDAWLSEVGHNRPGMKAGLPIDQALRKAAELDAKLGKLSSSEHGASLGPR